MNPPIGYPMLSDQLWEHIHTSNTKLTEQIIYLHTPPSKRSMILRESKKNVYGEVTIF